MSLEDRKVERHPSYGVASFSRVSSQPGAYLFGSEFTHGNYMTLRISRGERHRDLSNDWYIDRERVVEIAMSESQFVELITRPNMGGGVPVTIQWLDGVIEEPGKPDMRKRYTDDVKADTEACVADLRAATADLNAAIQSGKVGKAALRDIAKKLENAACAIDRGIPWVKKQFEESIESVIGQAKTEVEAHISATAMRIGIETMRLEAVRSAPQLCIESAPELEGEPA